MTITRVRPWHRLAAVLAAAAALPATAVAAHWPGLGGDSGRSGHQPVGAGTPPLRALYSRTDGTDQNVRTSLLATTGAVGVQRSAYGTANGHIHLRVLESGAAVAPTAGVPVDDGAADADVLPGGLVESSTTGGLGQLLAVHNDDDESATGDISIAQIDESSGSLIKQVPIAERETSRSGPRPSPPLKTGPGHGWCSSLPRAAMRSACSGFRSRTPGRSPRASGR